MEDQGRVTPAEIRQVDEQTFGITWQDGHKSKYPCDLLRLSCPCAACVDELTGKRQVTPDAIPKDIHPLRIQSVGRYGIQIRWSDQHSTGIYTFDFLRELCLCTVCKGGEKCQN
ncbi:MAG: hypothetical protein A3G87_06185 [Omnitrophica bacterium RIFCSPLOWO2_12_FULL_50_11]|nr:MAG: hypothetical protein A3G87_06185 [Omnitrophica bacterium RIFCSPLOWO2_12_FULL_50_11]